MNAVRIILAYLRVGILNELAYRGHFIVQLLQSSLGLATALIGLAVVFSHTTSLAGWRSSELLALVGIYFIVAGFLNVVVRPSLQRLMEDIRLGTLDYTLVRPADAQLLVSLKEVQLWRLADILLGCGVLGVALIRLGDAVGPAAAIAFGVVLAAGAAIVYSFLLILATLSFWVVRVTNILVIFNVMYEAGRWPVTIYPRWLQISLTFIVPVAFAITVPAETLVGRASPASLTGAVGLALVLLVISRWFWRLGLRHYSGASA
ncbi:MAG: ABC-2 family transporter protein [Chloroflexi bacterium]|nr:ABC-2 family transporter protein [Chloroflexota bacterium]